MIFEGVVEYEEEDGGKALIATLADEFDPGMFVRLQSWDEALKHVEAKTLEGKRVRVTVEVIG